ncbi:MAG TPA: histidine kinase [Beutenbergiaceae bacterium]|nr:histidine kinase [Beutenbergiaceae bacterium]
MAGVAVVEEREAGTVTDVCSLATSTDLFRWSRLSNPQRFEAYNRWSFYGLLGLTPFGALLMLTGAAPWSGARAGVYLLAMVIHTGVCLTVGARSFDHVLGRRQMPVRLLQLLAGSCVGVLAVVVWVFPRLDAEFSEMVTFAVVLTLLAALIAICPMINAWRVALAAVLVGVLAAALAALTGPLSNVIFGGVYGMLVGLVLGLTLRISVWTVLVVWEQERRREVDARLAVAEERLRFSRDLHDVFGRTLSTVAVKSELAAAFAERGDDRGVIEMQQVRTLAEDALKEVREVVQGYRAADLGTELAGAREILDASGVEVRVAGEDLDLPARVQQALAWVVREGATNVVRHSEATYCTIEVRESAEEYWLRIINDGASVTASHSGNGLRGLSERLAALGGDLQVVAHDDGQFSIEARLPRAALDIETAENTR